MFDMPPLCQDPDMPSAFGIISGVSVQINLHFAGVSGKDSRIPQFG